MVCGICAATAVVNFGALKAVSGVLKPVRGAPSMRVLGPEVVVVVVVERRCSHPFIVVVVVIAGVLIGILVVVVMVVEARGVYLCFSIMTDSFVFKAVEELVEEEEEEV